MMELRLHGALGRDFGKVWNLEVKTVREAMNALCALKPGFRMAVLALDKMGLVFRVRNQKEDLGEEHLTLNIPDTRVDIIPVVRGAGAGARVIAGVILVVVAVYLAYASGGTHSEAAWRIGMVGVSLILGGVSQLLSPQPKKSTFKDDAKSWTINGPLSTTDQGVPIPVVYGEVLTAGIPISAGMTTSRPVVYDTTTPLVTIGGDFDNQAWFGGAVSAGKVVLHFSASELNIQNVTGYAWSYTGFAAATSVVLSDQTTASVTLTITYNLPTVDAVSVDNFTISCTVTGQDTTSTPPANVTPNGAAAGTVTLDTRRPRSY